MPKMTIPTREQIEKIVKQLNDIENARPTLSADKIVERIGSLMSADTEVWANDRHIVGRSGADKLDRALFELVDDYHRDIENMVIDPPFVSFAWCMKSAKRNLSALGCSIMEINEVGLISRSWMFFDPAPFKAMGMQVQGIWSFDIVTLSPGTQLGPYEILSSIGAGGMGEVWKARDTRLGRIVAIKKAKEQHSERFKQEAMSIAALNHPYICQLHDIGEDYLVLEYVEGKPLSSPLPEKEAVRLAIQIAGALEAAHKKGIIHRDLKPANILVTTDGSVKLLDFGLAKLYEQNAEDSQLPTADYPATQAGAILGTVAYMSPEQAQGQPADARSDIFSFGLVLYEMLSGRRAFSGDSNPAILAALLRDEPAPLQVSSSVEKVVWRCLAKQPSGRYQTISEIKAALERVVAEQPTINSAEPQPSIAVLPFVNMSGDKEQEYFSDGLAEEIINSLAHILGLSVIARTSSFAFKGKQEDIRKIAEVLGATHVLEGSVRKAGERVRVTAQLIAAVSGIHLWSERYDRNLTDIFVVQDEIAAAIAGALEVKLSATSIKRQYKPSLAAHEAYLKARYLWGNLNPEALAQARKYLEQAIELDPDYALAHCGLADHYFLLTSAEYMPAHQAMPIVRQEAEKAIEIDPFLPEAHGLLGLVSGVYDYDWKESEREFRLAMAREPVPPRVRQWFGGSFLYAMGWIANALEQTEQGIKEDPLSVTASVHLTLCLMLAGRTADAQREMLRILEFHENHPWVVWLLAFAYAQQGKWEEALHAAQKASPMIPLSIGPLAAIFKCIGEQKRSEEWMQKLLQKEAHAVPIGQAIFSLLCGDLDKAMDWFEKAVEQREPLGTFLLFKEIRSSPRWPELAKKMNLPEDAR